MIALREGDVYLRGRRFLFRTDHEPIRYLQTKAGLTGRQTRWLYELKYYSYTTQHIPGKNLVVPDAHSRRHDHAENFNLKHRELTSPSYKRKIQASYEHDEWSQDLIRILRDGLEPENKGAKIQASNYDYSNGMLYWIGTSQSRPYMPSGSNIRNDIITKFHTTPHWDINKTYSVCTIYTYWPKMYDDIVSYCN